MEENVAKRILEKKHRRRPTTVWVCFMMLLLISLVLLIMSFAKQKVYQEELKDLEQESGLLSQTLNQLKGQLTQRDEEARSRDTFLSNVKRDQSFAVKKDHRAYSALFNVDQTLAEDCIALGPLLDLEETQGIEAQALDEIPVQNKLEQKVGVDTPLFVEALRTLAAAGEVSLLHVCGEQDQVYVLGHKQEVAHVFRWAKDGGNTRFETARFVAYVFHPDGNVRLDTHQSLGPVMLTGVYADAIGTTWKVYRVDFASRSGDLVEDCEAHPDPQELASIQIHCDRLYSPSPSTSSE